MAKKKQLHASRESLRIPLDFKQTVLAALETKPEPRKSPKKKPRGGKA
jgi:hypothetical protein